VVNLEMIVKIISLRPAALIDTVMVVKSFPLLGATDKDFSIGKDRHSHVPFGHATCFNSAHSQAPSQYVCTHDIVWGTVLNRGQPHMLGL
jgi:hypothetical protein